MDLSLFNYQTLGLPVVFLYGSIWFLLTGFKPARQLVVNATETADRQYFSLLFSLLRWTSNVWGKPRSLRALSVSIALAMGYSTLFYLISWTAGGAADIGGITLMPNIAELNTRLGYLCFCITCVIIVNELFARAPEIDAKYRSLLSVSIGEDRSTSLFKQKLKIPLYEILSSMLIIIVIVGPGVVGHLVDPQKSVSPIFALAATFGFVMVVMSAEGFPGLIPSLLGFSFAVSLILNHARLFSGGAPAVAGLAGTATSLGIVRLAKRNLTAYKIRGLSYPNIKERELIKGKLKFLGTADTFSLLGGCAGAFGEFIAGFFAASGFSVANANLGSANVAAVIFMVLLPVANGVWDYISLMFSRILGVWLLIRLRRRFAGRLKIVLRFVGIDLIVVVATMLGLLASFGLLLAWLATTPIAIETNSSFDAMKFLEDARRQSFLQNLWIYIMLFSTLAPSLLHAFLSSIALTIRLFLWTDMQCLLEGEIKPMCVAGAAFVLTLSVILNIVAFTIMYIVLYLLIFVISGHALGDLLVSYAEWWTAFFLRFL